MGNDEKVWDVYFSMAKKYIELGIVNNPNLQDPTDLANYLMNHEGINLSKIRTGDQEIPEEILKTLR
jgi:hypothetical protein